MPNKHVFTKHLLFYLHVSCLLPLWSPKPLTPTRSFVFSWICYLRWEFRPFCKLHNSLGSLPRICCCCSVAKSCLILCNSMGGSTLGFSVLHCLPEFAQIPVHWVTDPIQSSQPLPPLCLLPWIFPNIRVFSSESALHFRWWKYWSFSNSPSLEYSESISFRIDWFDVVKLLSDFLPLTCLMSV